jgi:hypothetical protein
MFEIRGFPPKVGKSGLSGEVGGEILAISYFGCSCAMLWNFQCLITVSVVILDTHSAVKEYLTLNEEAKTREHQWLLVFDRSDLIMFMAFQLMHIVSFVIVFYRYFDKFQH